MLHSSVPVFLFVLFGSLQSALGAAVGGTQVNARASAGCMSNSECNSLSVCLKPYLQAGLNPAGVAGQCTFNMGNLTKPLGLGQTCYVVSPLGPFCQNGLSCIPNVVRPSPNLGTCQRKACTVGTLASCPSPWAGTSWVCLATTYPQTFHNMNLGAPGYCMTIYEFGLSGIKPGTTCPAGRGCFPGLTCRNGICAV